MKKLYLFIVSALLAAVASAQEAPLYTAMGQVGEAEGYGTTYLPEVKDVPVDVYNDYVIVQGLLGVEGYDMKVVFDGDDNVLSVTPIVNGVEGQTVKSGYLTLYTGLESPAYIQPYLGTGYSYAGTDEEGGYVLLYAYVGSVFCYYYIEWENESGETPGEEETTPQLLYSTIGEVCEADGYGESLLPTITDVNIDVYNGYIIINDFLGAKGYDLKVTFGEDETISSLTPIIDGVEGTTVESGSVKLTTGLSSPRTILVYLGDYSSGYVEGDEGYVMLGCYVNNVWGYYYIYWPQEEEEEVIEPVYSTLGEVTVDEDWGESFLPNVRDIAVDVYEDYTIINGVLGVPGYDLKVVFGEDDTIVSLTSIVDGEEVDTVESGYLTLSTGLQSPSYINIYLIPDYCYGASDVETEDGYVMLSCYVGANNDWGYYYLYWPQEELPDYISVGEVTDTEGWGKSAFPALNDVKVEAYSDYVIIRAFAGTEGYDMMVGIGENDNVTFISSIVDGEEVETVTSGYITVATGNDIEFQPYLAAGFCYAGLYDDESGYVILSANVNDEWSYYYIYWPQDDEEQGEWVNPFDRESTYLYSSVGDTGEAEDWGETLFPEVKDIAVDVYDNYIYVHAFAGVEGYDIKVAFDEEDTVLSIQSVTDGVESDPCKSYIYLTTGREDVITVQAYVGEQLSYAGVEEDKSGYVLLGAYLYFADDTFDWNYYYLTWDGTTGIASVSVDATSSTLYNILGQPVSGDYRGFVIKDGKKYLNR